MTHICHTNHINVCQNQNYICSHLTNQEPVLTSSRDLTNQGLVLTSHDLIVSLLQYVVYAEKITSSCN